MLFSEIVLECASNLFVSLVQCRGSTMLDVISTTFSMAIRSTRTSIPTRMSSEPYLNLRLYVFQSIFLGMETIWCVPRLDSENIHFCELQWSVLSRIHRDHRSLLGNLSRRPKLNRVLSTWAFEGIHNLLAWSWNIECSKNSRNLKKNIYKNISIRLFLYLYRRRNFYFFFLENSKNLIKVYLYLSYDINYFLSFYFLYNLNWA